MEMADERYIIYLALSNLIKDCIETLDGIENMPKNERISPEDKGLLQYILESALPLEDKYRKEITQEEDIISRPDWDKI